MGIVRLLVVSLGILLPTFANAARPLKDEPMPEAAFVLNETKLKPLNSAASKLTPGSKATVIVMWASWCKFCRDQLIQLNGVYSKYKDKGLQIVAVSVDDNEEEARKEAASKMYAFPVVLDVDKSVKRQLNVGKIPDTYVLNAQLRTVSVYRGMSQDRYTYLRKRIMGLLEQMEDE